MKINKHRNENGRLRYSVVTDKGQLYINSDDSSYIVYYYVKITSDSSKYYLIGEFRDYKEAKSVLNKLSDVEFGTDDELFDQLYKIKWNSSIRKYLAEVAEKRPLKTSREDNDRYKNLNRKYPINFLRDFRYVNRLDLSGYYENPPSKVYFAELGIRESDVKYPGLEKYINDHLKYLSYINNVSLEDFQYSIPETSNLDELNSHFDTYILAKLKELKNEQ